jgi:hypothetical protein
MSSSVIRSYFDTQINIVDATISAWNEDLFGNNEESNAISAKYYNLIVGKCRGDRDGNSHWEEYDISLDVFALEARDVLTTFDAVYDKAISIKNELINHKNYNNTLNDIEFIEAEPIEDADNDNSIKIRLNFIVRFNYNLT